MREQSGVSLADLTTLHLGGPARRLLIATSEAEVVETVRAADAAGEPLLVLGGGSNVVVADDGFDGIVLQVATTGVETGPEPHTLQVAAGVDWDHLVALSVEQGMSGLEALSGIPGRVGAAPIQNVGAYGQEVAAVVRDLRVLDRRSGDVVTLPAAGCGFGYRDSVFKRSPRYVVLAVSLALGHDPLGAAVRYAELARALGVEVGDPAPPRDVRRAVLALRRRKGMLLEPPPPAALLARPAHDTLDHDAHDHDTWSAGSFFTNPVLPEAAAAGLPPEAPRWPSADGRVKTSAAWLIEQAGFGKGYGRGHDPRARVSTKHTLALTNTGGATTVELLDLAREIRAGVAARFAVTLEIEPVLVGVTL